MTNPQWRTLRRKLRRAGRRIKRIKAIKRRFRIEWEGIMGDRGNIFITKNESTLDGDLGIYLYTHWNGYRIKQTLQTALKRQQRWDDEAYLNRIIFCEMVKGFEEAETGYGISLEMQDNNNDIVNILTDPQEVRIGEEKWSFAEFIELSLS